MRFQLYKDRFRRLGDHTEYGTIPLYSEANGKNLFLPLAAEPLLQLAESSPGWHVFEEVARDFEEEQQRALEDALVILSSFGLAECLQEEEQREGVWVVGEKEYKEVVSFIREAQAEGGGYLLEGRGSTDYFSVPALRARQFNNLCYHFMYRRDDLIRGVMFVSMMDREIMPTAILLAGLLFRPGLRGEERKVVFQGLLQYVAGAFRQDYAKLRFLYKCEAEAETLSLLLEAGFRKIAVLPRELADGGSVTLYDYDMRKGDAYGSSR